MPAIRTLATGVLLVLVVAAPPLRADTFEQIRQRGALRWGGDKVGGGPYIYEDDEGKLTGFEVELAQYLATELGLESEFVQGQWDKLPSRLNRRDLDMVLNGYEWSAEREQEWASTIPYYIYRLQLIARDHDRSIRSWDDLKGKRVGVLRGSAAHRYLQEHFGSDVELAAYSEGGTSAMRLVANGQLDATVQDFPLAIHYLKREFPTLRLVGDPVEPGYYVIFVRRSDSALRDRLNQAILKSLRDGVLRRIYGNYGIWTSEQENLGDLANRWPPEPPPPVASWSNLREYAVTLAQAAWTTVLLSFLAMPIAMLIGMLVAIGRLYGPGWLSGLLATYVELLRGTPLMLQLYVIYFLLPEIGIFLPAFWAGALGLALNYSSCQSENYRAGMLAVPRGQMEAALSLGMSQWTSLRKVIIPQAFRMVVPLDINNFIALFKDTSICSVIAVTELSGSYSELLNNHPSIVIQLGLMTAILYLLMSYPLTLLSKRLERRFHRVVM